MRSHRYAPFTVAAAACSLMAGCGANDAASIAPNAPASLAPAEAPVLPDSLPQRPGAGLTADTGPYNEGIHAAAPDAVRGRLPELAPQTPPVVDDPDIPSEPTDVDPVGDEVPEELRHGHLRTRFSGLNSGSNEVILRSSGHFIAMRATQLRARRGDEILASERAAATRPEADDGDVLFRSVFPDADLRFETRRNALVELLDLASLPALLEAAPEAETLELVSELRLPARAVLLLPDGAGQLQPHAAPVQLDAIGGVGIGDATRPEAPWFVIPAPFAMDADGLRIDGEVTITLRADGSAEYVTRIPAAWLRDSARAWPVRIDPPVALGGGLPWLATANLDRLPSSSGVSVHLSAVAQDAEDSSSDLTVNWEVAWGDGTTSSARPGPGGRVLTHTYADANACNATGGECRVVVTLRDALGRSRSTTLRYVLSGRDFRICRYTCQAQSDEVPFRSFWHRPRSCDGCAAALADHCGNPPDVAQACTGGQDVEPDGPEPELLSLPTPLVRQRTIASNDQVQARRTPGSYTYTFWIRPRGTRHGFSNIIHKGATNEQRNPAIFFYPRSTRLHVRSGTQGQPSAGADPSRILPLNRWTHVAVRHRDGSLQVFIDGNLEAEAALPRPAVNSGPLWGSNPWHEAADATIANLRIYRDLPADAIAAEAQTPPE